MIAEVQNQNALEEIIAEIATSTTVARRIVRKTAIPQKIETAEVKADNAQTTANEAKQAAEDAGGISNDNIAPAVPSAPSVSVFERNLSISWTPAPVGEYVVKTHVRMTPAGGTAITRTTTDTYYIATKLTVNVVHDIEVQFEDRWGLTSGWSPITQATPQPTIADQLAADVQVEATRISGLLGEDKLAQITSPTKLAEAIYTTAIERGGRGANLLVFDKAEASAWAVGALPQRGYTALASSGRTPSVVSHAGDQWWQVVSDSTPTAETSVSFYANYENVTMAGGDTYIYSAMVKNIGSTETTARVAMQEATDTAGTGVATKFGSAVTIPPDGKIYRIFVRFPNDKTRPYKRPLQYVGAGASTVIFNKFQLEEVGPAQGVPGRYTLPVINTGALTARLMTAWDLAAVRAMIGDLTVETAKIADAAIVTAKIGDAQITTAKILDASITSAKINTIVADKITSGTLAATTITLGTDGVLKAGPNTVLDAGGLTLRPNKVIEGAWELDRTISGGFWSYLGFFQEDLTANNPARGMYMRADGNTDRRGVIFLRTTMAGDATSTSTTTAYLQLESPQSGNGVVVAGGQTFFVMGNAQLQNDLLVKGTYRANASYAAASIAANSSRSVTHPFGYVPKWHEWFWTPAPDMPLPSNDDLLFVQEMTSTGAVIRNNASASRSCYGWFYR